MSDYAYIDNEFGRLWVASKHEARRGVFTPLAYIDINDGNRFDADVFAQIMYWHEPNAETHQPRLTRQRDGHLWLVKNHGDWWSETRIAKRTVRTCLERIANRKLIIYALHGERGNVTPWIRINWDEFELRMRLWMLVNASRIVETDYKSAWLDVLASHALTRHTPDFSGHTPMTFEDSPVTANVISNTETTPETSHRDIPAGRENGKSSSVPKAQIDPMKNAIALAFGWQWETMTGSAQGTIQKTARELCLAGYKPEDVKGIYAYCKAMDFKNFTPIALTKHAEAWRVTRPKKPTTQIIPLYDAPPAPQPMPEDVKAAMAEIMQVHRNRMSASYYEDKDNGHKTGAA